MSFSLGVDKPQQHNYTFPQWVAIFHGAEGAIRTTVKAILRKTQYDINDLDDFRNHFTENVIQKADFRKQPEMIAALDAYVAQYMDHYCAVVDECKAKLAYLKEPKSKEILDVERAKTVPIARFLKVNRGRKALCIFHTEKTPSMHVYPDNHAFCFSCQRSADVIDIVQELQKCSFKEAVKFLNV